MRLASFNVENLFLRADALDQATWADGKEVLAKHATLNGIFNHPNYSAADKTKIVELLNELGIKGTDEGPFVILRQNKGKLLKRPQAGGLEVVANGRGDWVGWLDLKVQELNEIAIQNTARVMKDVNADVQAVVEVESRPALLRFSGQVMPMVGGAPFDHVMLIDGNDDRGIDVGIMLRNGYEITKMRSHVDDTDADGIIFSRDCPEYFIKTPKGNEIVVLVNHLKSQGFGTQNANDKKRERQARRIVQIYKDLLAEGITNVAVVGDFNDDPESNPLKPLLIDTDLKDVSTMPGFQADPNRPGTFQNCTAKQKIDYILLSPPLFAALKAGAIFRDGVWGGKNGDLFAHYPEITKPAEAASDHAAIWAEIDV